MKKEIIRKISATVGAMAAVIIVCMTITFIVYADNEPSIEVQSITGDGIVYVDNTIYVDGTKDEVKAAIEGKVTGSLNNEAKKVFYDMDNEPKNTFDSLSFSVELLNEGEFCINDACINSNSQKLNLYVVRASSTEEDPGIVVKTFDIKKKPTLSLKEEFIGGTYTINNWGDYTGKVEVKFEVNDNANGFMVALSDNNFEDKDDKTIISKLHGRASENLTSQNYEMSTPENKTVTVYLYKENVIFDKEELQVKLGNNFALPEFGVKESGYGSGVSDSIVVIEKSVSENSVSFEAEIRDDWGNSYKIEWKDGNNDSKSQEGNGGNYDNGKAKYTITGTISSISDVPSSGKDFTIELKKKNNNEWYKVGEATIKVKDKVPQITWEQNVVTTVTGGTDEINLPLTLPPGKETFYAYITDYATGDKVYKTISEILATDYSTYNWNSLTEETIQSEGNDKFIKVEPQYLNSITGETLYFYMQRTVGNENQVYKLGEWKIGYKDIVKYWYSVPEPNKTVFEMGSPAVLTSFAKKEEGKTTYGAVIRGYYTNGMDEDKIIWTTETYEDVMTWAKSESSNVEEVGVYYGDSRYFEIYLKGLSYDTTDTEKIYHFYIRRPKTSNADPNYTVFHLADITIKKDNNPVLETATAEVGEDVTKWWERFFQGKVSRYSTDIKIDAKDDETGIKSVTVKYNKEDDKGNIVYRDCELFKESKSFNENCSVSKTLNLTESERKSCYVLIEDWSGNIVQMNDIFKIMPKVTVEMPSGLTNSYDGEAYTSSSNNQEIVVTVSSYDETGESLDGADTTYLKNVNVEVSGVRIANKTYNDSYYKESFTFNLNDSRINVPADGKYNILVSVENTEGNKQNTEVTFIYDNTNPAITSIKIDGQDVTILDSNENYEYFFNSPKDITVTADDGINGSGLKSIDYYWLDSDGKKKTGSKSVENEQNSTADIERNESYRSRFYVTATDNAGNKIMENGKEKYYTIGGIIVDTPTNHGSENHVSISADATSSKDAKGNPLYNSSFKAILNVTDSFAGIRSVEWRVNKDGSTTLQSGSMTVSNGTINGDSWGINGKERNIVTDISKAITVDGNGDNMSIYLKMTDNAGNTSEKTMEFSIDNVKPTISVTLDNTTGDSEFKNYYQHEIKATVVVKDRYFDPSSFSIANSAGNKGTITGWTEKKDAENPDNSTYTAVATFANDDRYILSFTCKDKAGNSSDKVDVSEFVIDTKSPEVTVTFEGATATSGFYSAERKATIFVKDANFESTRVAITGALADNGYELSNWTKRDDGYYAVMTIKKDGTYNFSVTATDKAGNKGNLENIPSFVMDTQKPVITIEGVEDKSSNKDKVAPFIKIEDLNADKNTIVVELNGAKQGKVDISEWYTKSEDGLEITFKNFAKEKNIDDLYTLKVSAKDKAGNESVKEIKFSVNRFGSIYYLSDELQKINDKYVKKVNGVVITEINPDKISKKSVIITFSINGNPRTLKEGEDYSISSEEGEGEWKTYKYTLLDSLFEQDGSYVITLSSEDEAGNINNNVEKETELKFGVDATAPIVAALDFDANTFYYENGKDVSVSIKDNILLDDVKIYIDNKEIEYSVNEEVYSFRIPESNKAQSIKIVAKDKAGNETFEVYEGVLVSGNFFIRLLQDKLMLLGIIGGGSIILIGGTIFGFKKFGK